MSVAPAKPWEIRRTQNGTSTAPVPTSSSSSLQPNVTTTTSSSTPTVPARPNSMGYGLNRTWDSRNSYNSPYSSSSYNSYSPYQSYSPYSSYNSYGSSYGSRYGYSNNSYGGYGQQYGYGQYGGYGQQYGQVGPGGLMDAGYRSFGQVAEGFSRFSHLIDLTFDALRGSFANVMRFVELAGEFLYVFKTFALVQVVYRGTSNLGKLFRWLLFGSKFNATGANYLQEYLQHHSNERWRRVMLPVILIFMGMFVVGTPMVLVKFYRMIKKQQELMQLEQKKVEQSNEPQFVIAVADFQGTNDMELSFRKEDKFVVISKPYQDWWEGEMAGRKGLFPANFVQPIIVEPQNKTG